MTEQAPVEQQHWFLVLLSWAGYLLELASMLVLLILVVMTIDIHSHPPSEGKSWSMMGLVLLVYYSLFIVVPATLVAMGRAAAAFGKPDEQSSLAPLAFHGAAALLPFAAYALVFKW